ncbi:pEARLI1-like lipid transfer protein 1 [Wolffia australiana]
MASKSQFMATLVLANLLLATLVVGQPSPSPSPPPNLISCVINTLNLALCGTVVSLFKLLGIQPSQTRGCCAVINSVPVSDAISCLCVSIKANILGIGLSIPGDVGLLIRLCGRDVPIGLACP